MSPRNDQAMGAANDFRYMDSTDCSNTNGTAATMLMSTNTRYFKGGAPLWLAKVTPTTKVPTTRISCINRIRILTAVVFAAMRLTARRVLVRSMV